LKIIAAPEKDITLAIAGVFQSATLVSQIARLNYYDEQALHQSSHSLIRLNVDSVDEIYGTVYGVQLGLRTITNLFSRKPGVSTKDVFQYAVAVHQLALKLNKLQKTSDVIRSELELIRLQISNDKDDDIEDDALHQSLADLYSRTVSYLTPRIIVRGSSTKLQHPKTVYRIRTALFAGIRSAHLWHQLGGRRWQLMFNRQGYVHMARALLNS